MVYQIGNRILQQTQEIFRGEVNDVIVCQDMAANGKVYYTVLVVHDRELAKRLMGLFHTDTDRKTGQGNQGFITDFTWKNSYLMVFDYVKERSLKQFFSSEIATLQECELLAQNLTVECLAGGIPYPILYLQLKQDQIHISKDKSVYLGFNLDLTEFSEKKTEKECATLCAKKIFGYIEAVSTQRTTSYKLLEKRVFKSGYPRFTDLYKDLKMAAQPLKKESLLVRLKKSVKNNQDRLFKLLLIVCVLLGILALAMIISQMLFSDVPFLRILFNPFKVIGTESLLQ